MTPTTAPKTTFQLFKDAFPLMIRMAAGNPSEQQKLKTQLMHWSPEERAELMVEYQPVLDKMLKTQQNRERKKVGKRDYQAARQALQFAKIDETQIREEARRKIAALNIPALEHAVIEARVAWYGMKGA